MIPPCLITWCRGDHTRGHPWYSLVCRQSLFSNHTSARCAYLSDTSVEESWDCQALLHSPCLICIEEALLPPGKIAEFGFLDSQAGSILGRGPKGEVASPSTVSM